MKYIRRPDGGRDERIVRHLVILGDIRFVSRVEYLVGSRGKGRGCGDKYGKGSTQSGGGVGHIWILLGSYPIFTMVMEISVT